MQQSIDILLDIYLATSLFPFFHEAILNEVELRFLILKKVGFGLPSINQKCYTRNTLRAEFSYFWLNDM